MDAVKFLTEKYRMCRNIQDCRDCELDKDKCCSNFNTEEKAKKAVALVERWSKEHPKKTRQSEFLKVYPNAVLSILDNYPSIDPCKFDSTLCNGSRCRDLCCSRCREEYWTEEVK